MVDDKKMMKIGFDETNKKKLQDNLGKSDEDYIIDLLNNKQYYEELRYLLGTFLKNGLEDIVKNKFSHPMLQKQKSIMDILENNDRLTQLDLMSTYKNVILELTSRIEAKLEKIEKKFVVQGKRNVKKKRRNKTIDYLYKYNKETKVDEDCKENISTSKNNYNNQGVGVDYSKI